MGIETLVRQELEPCLQYARRMKKKKKKESQGENTLEIFEELNSIAGGGIILEINQEVLTINIK